LFKGEVESFDAKLSQDARMLMVRARVPNPDRKLLPGMFANVAVLAGSAKDFVTVPRTAVTYGLYGDSVWVVKESTPEPAPAPTPTAAAEPVVTPAAADAAPTGAIPAEPKLTVDRRFVRVGPTEGDRVAIAKENRRRIRVGQLLDDREVCVIEGATKGFAFAPDGKSLVRTGYGREVERNLGAKIGQAAVVDHLKAAAEWILSRAENQRMQPA